MQKAVSTRTPAHLWIVGSASLLWNAFGAYDYLMTRFRNMDYLSSMGDPNAMLAYIDGMPLYAHVGWGLGVWGSLPGSVLLLARSRYAVHSFAISLIGAILSLGSQYIGPPPPPEMTDGALKYVPLMIIGIIALLLWYSWRQEKNGLLRLISLPCARAAVRLRISRIR